MSQMLAPYHSGMRIGTGFNSYTQQLCINNAVIKENKEPATVADLRPQGTEELSQTVKWSGRFVESASDVLESLDISGALSIKFGGGTQGAKGEGAYLKTSKIKDSQINYFLDVTVTNQRLLAADVTKFNAVPNCPKGQFTEVYGDSFISGFLEGGTFHALVSIKVDNKDDILKVRGALEVAFKAGPVDVNAEAKGSYEDIKLKSGTSTTISVDWTGGGTLTQKDTKEWTIDALKATAYAFPAKCAKYPQYTHAILTKYTALRSYQELANKGTPLDYENAGTYTKTLLDSYLDYKQIWSDIDVMAQRFQGNLNRYTVSKSTDPLFESYAEEAAEVYDRQCRAFYYPNAPPDKARKAIRAPVSATPTIPDSELEKRTQDLAKADHDIIVAKKKLTAIEHGEHFEPPLKPNALVMYPPTILGFDRARRDCRWEMIKIVKEVDAVTNDPNVAIDPTRIWQYLHPTVFRLLLPRPDPPLPPYTPEWVAQETDKFKKDADAANTRAAAADKLAAEQAARIQTLEDDLKILKKDYVDLEKDKKGLEEDKDTLTKGNQAFVVAVAAAGELVKDREADLKALREAQVKAQQDFDAKIKEQETALKTRDKDTPLIEIVRLKIENKQLKSNASALETQIGDLKLTVMKKNGLHPMYSGKTVYIMNIGQRMTAWIAIGAYISDRDDYWAKASSYDGSSTNRSQHFKLECLPNGNWTIKNIHLDRYLEADSNDNGAALIHQRQTTRRVGEDAMCQEWQLTWTRGGLTLENAGCPGTVVYQDS